MRFIVYYTKKCLTEQISQLVINRVLSTRFPYKLETQAVIISLRRKKTIRVVKKRTKMCLLINLIMTVFMMMDFVVKYSN